MERHLNPVIIGLSTFINAFPLDDEKHKELRAICVKAKEAVEGLRDEMNEEEEKAFKDAKVSLVAKEDVGIELCPPTTVEAEVPVSKAKKSQRVLEAKLMIAELTAHLAALEADQEETKEAKEGNVVVGGLKEE